MEFFKKLSLTFTQQKNKYGTKLHLGLFFLDNISSRCY